MNQEQFNELRETAKEIRRWTLESIAHLGVGHVGGSMSITEVLTYLYFHEMRVDPKNPRSETRDRLVLSKGHAGPTLYSILAKKGFFPKEWLMTLNEGGTKLPSHCDRNLTPGIDMTTGSLGQGLSAAAGIALANKLDSRDNYVYAIIGDGESQEGQVWEAAMFAPQQKLHHLIAFTDYNKMQIDGLTKEVIDIDPLEAKWLAFGWHIQRVDGHNFYALEDAVQRAKEEVCRPSMIILDTIKGKDCCFAENKVSSHNMPVTQEQFQEALKTLS